MADWPAEPEFAVSLHMGALGFPPSTKLLGRRLYDKLVVAFDQACNQHEFEAAQRLLAVIETLLTRRGPQPGINRRRALESLVAAHERLFDLRTAAHHMAAD